MRKLFIINLIILSTLLPVRVFATTFRTGSDYVRSANITPTSYKVITDNWNEYNRTNVTKDFYNYTWNTPSGLFDLGALDSCYSGSCDDTSMWNALRIYFPVLQGGKDGDIMTYEFFLDTLYYLDGGTYASDPSLFELSMAGRVFNLYALSGGALMGATNGCEFYHDNDPENNHSVKLQCTGVYNSSYNYVTIDIGFTHPTQRMGGFKILIRNQIYYTFGTYPMLPLDLEADLILDIIQDTNPKKVKDGFGSHFSNMSGSLADDGTVSSLVLLPVNLLNKIKDGINGSCSAFNLSFLGKNINFPCLNLSSYLGSAYTIIDTIISGILIYKLSKLFINIFICFSSLSDIYHSKKVGIDTTYIFD